MQNSQFQQSNVSYPLILYYFFFYSTNHKLNYAICSTYGFVLVDDAYAASVTVVHDDAKDVIITC